MGKKEQAYLKITNAKRKFMLNPATWPESLKMDLCRQDHKMLVALEGLR